MAASPVYALAANSSPSLSSKEEALNQSLHQPQVRVLMSTYFSGRFGVTSLLLDVPAADRLAQGLRRVSPYSVADECATRLLSG
jgi:hypothetical protein